MIGLFAISTAGHDNGQLYVIIKEEMQTKATGLISKRLVYVSDGRLKTIEKPKKKSLKHLQLIKKQSNQELIEKLSHNETVTNEEIRRAIRQKQALGGIECQKLM